MVERRSVSPDRLPTLTDVLHTGDRVIDVARSQVVAENVSDDSALTQALLNSIQARVDTQFEARLREAIAPALARAVDGLLREIGPELALALRETAERAVSQELARRKDTP